MLKLEFMIGSNLRGIVRVRGWRETDGGEKRSKRERREFLRPVGDYQIQLITKVKWTHLSKNGVKIDKILRKIINSGISEKEDEN